jgi:hypothetical protein
MAENRSNQGNSSTKDSGMGKPRERNGTDSGGENDGGKRDTESRKQANKGGDDRSRHHDHAKDQDSHDRTPTKGGGAPGMGKGPQGGQGSFDNT